MAYVGNTPSRGQWRKLTDISGSFNGVTTTFTTSVPPGTSQYYVTAGTASQLIISLGGVIQEPDVDYSVSTNSITFTTAPAAGLSFFGVLCGDALNTGVPSDGSITTSKLGGNLTVDLASGSASTPSLTFDTNTGLYSPGEDQVAVSTGGTKRFEIDGSGNINIDSNTLYVDAVNNRVGVGTTSPNVALTISSGAVSTGAVIPTSDIAFPSAYANGFFRAVGNYNVGAGTGGTIQLGGKSYTDAPYVGAFLISAVSAGNATDALTFSTQTSYTNVVSEKARLTTDGKLLVGTSSTDASLTSSLQVVGSGFSGTQLLYRYDANSAGPALFLGKSRSSTIGTKTLVVNNDELGTIAFYGADGSVDRQGASIQAAVDGTPGAGDLPTRLVFSTTADGASSPTERMRIAQNGIIDSFSAGSAYIVRTATGAGTAGELFHGLYSASGPASGGTSSIKIYTNGNIQNSNNSYGALSDIKLKENIVDANSQWDDLKALQVRNYNFKEGQTHTQIGLVAQEVELVSPGLVTESPDRDAEGNDLGTITKSVNYSVLYMKAVKALQEAMERIEQLETEMAFVKAKLL